MVPVIGSVIMEIQIVSFLIAHLIVLFFMNVAACQTPGRVNPAFIISFFLLQISDLLPTDQFSFTVEDLVPNMEYAFQVMKFSTLRSIKLRNTEDDC